MLRLLDHLVGELLQMQGHVETERLGALKVVDELEFRCPLDRKTSGILTLDGHRQREKQTWSLGQVAT